MRSCGVLGLAEISIKLKSSVPENEVRSILPSMVDPRYAFVI